MSSGWVWGLGGLALCVWSWIGIGQIVPKMDTELRNLVTADLAHYGLETSVRVDIIGQSVYLSASGPDAQSRLEKASRVMSSPGAGLDTIYGPLTTVRYSRVIVSDPVALREKQEKTLAATAIQVSQPATATIISAPTHNEAKSCEDAVIKQIGDRKLSFKFNGYELTPDDAPIIDDIYKVIQTCPSGVKLVIEGHTDAVGDAQTNRLLSKGRAGSAAYALMAKGLSADRVTFEGFGADKPIADNATAEGRALNRRVVIHVVKP